MMQAVWLRRAGVMTALIVFSLFVLSEGFSLLELGEAEALLLSDHKRPVTVSPLVPSDDFGVEVASLGDLDRDGTPDFAVGRIPGTFDFDDGGSIQIIFMNPDGTAKSKANIDNSTAGVNDAGRTFGTNFASVGDRNGDGTFDLAAIIGGNPFLGIVAKLHFLYLDTDGSVSETTSGSVPLRSSPLAITGIGDLDGDGVGDVALGSYDVATTVGSVQILFMNADDTIRETVHLGGDTPAFSGITHGSNFGFELAGIGDINGDGTREIAVGAISEDGAGAVYILFMDPSGSVGKVAKIGKDTPNMGGISDGSKFGASIETIGDADGDGVDDLAVGAPGASGDRGSIHLVFLNADGSVKGAEVINHNTYRGPRLNTDDGLGIAMALLGDTYRDGSTTLAVGASGKNRVFLVSINVNSPNANGAVDSHTTMSVVDSRILPFPGDGEIGRAAARMPDLDGNGVSDLAVGAPGSNDGKGAVYILYMGRYGVPVGYDVIDDSTENGPNLDSGDRFGSSIAVDDWNGDGVADLAVGAPEDDAGGTKRGTVHMVLLNSDATVKNTVEINKLTASINVANYDQFGSSVLAIGDVDSNGMNDLAVGAPLNDYDGNDRGAIRILRLDQNLDVIQSRLIESDSVDNSLSLQKRDRFGSSMALVEGIDGAAMGIAVGAPGTHWDSGAVHVLGLGDDDAPDSYAKIAIPRNTLLVGSSAGSVVYPSIGFADRFGSALSAIGDVDGNGVTDLLVTGTGERGDDAGVMHVLLLESDGGAKDTYKIQSGIDAESAAVSVRDVDIEGATVTIQDENDLLGSSVVLLDDLDRDGTAEILVGAPGRDDESGALYVAYMNADGSSKRATPIDKNMRVSKDIESGDLFGASVAAVGDVDRNGVVDIVVGSPKVDTGPTLGTDKGAVRLFFMGADGAFSRVVRIDDDTANGPDLSQFDRFGTSVAGIGDLNRDGTPDVAVGAPYVNTGPFDKGAVFILFLNPDGSVNKTKKIDDDTANGPTLQAFSKFGSSVAGIGDLDLDGTVDLAVGAEGHTSSNRGALFVLFMKPDGSVRQTAQIGQASGNGPALSSNGAFGSSVAPIGDLDGNGVVDIAVGADRTGSEGGAVYLLFMNANGTAKDTAVLSNGTAGMPTLLDGVSFGSSVAGPGDLDGDGAPDLLVGTPGDGSWGADTGVLYAIFLNPDGTVARTQLLDSVTPNIPDISSGDMFGSSIASLGDLNRDGVVDIAVGASGAGLGGDAHVLLLDKSTIVTGVTSPRPDGTYTEPGTLIPVEVSFSEPVTVTGAPYLLMDVGVPPGSAVYSSGSGSMTLTFNYEVDAGDVSPDLDYAGSSSLRIPRDSSISAQEQPSADAVTHLPPPAGHGSLSHAKNIGIDTLSGPRIVLVGPSVQIIELGDPYVEMGAFSHDGSQVIIDSSGVDAGAIGRYVVTYTATDSHDRTSQVIRTVIVQQTYRPAVTVSPLVPSDDFGVEVASLGDLDRDGTPDFAVGRIPGTFDFDDGGSIQIIFMNPDGTAKSKANIDNSTAGVNDAGRTFGTNFASVGDRNGDGTFDLAAIIGGNPFLGIVAKLHFLYLDTDGSVSETTSGSVPLRSSPLAITGIGDLDGDGVGDVALGSYDVATTVGSVQILFMNADDTIRETVHLGGDTPAFSGITHGSNFGFELAGIGDINGDGTREIAVGAISEDGAGAVYILFMDPSGSVGKVAKIGKDTPNMGGISDGSKFGASIETIGDADGDGVDDLAVGAPGASGDRGSIHLVFLNADGSVKGAEVINHNTYRGPRLNTDDGLGIAMALLGDTYRDGSTTLAVGASGKNRVFLVSINVNSPNANGAVDSHTTMSVVDSRILPFPGDGEIGRAAARMPDLDGNGVSDLAVGAPGSNDGKGAVYILYMGRYGVPVGYDVIDDSTENGPNLDSGDRFGSSIAVDDWNGDGVPDLAVGAPGKDNEEISPGEVNLGKLAGGTDSGAIYMILLDSDGTVKSTVEITTDAFGFTRSEIFRSLSITKYDQFGDSLLAIGDIDSNGVPDLAVGTPRGDIVKEDDLGAVFILRLDYDLGIRGYSKTTTGLGIETGLSLKADDRFGASMALVEGLDDAALGIAMGAPGTWSDRGAVHILAYEDPTELPSPGAPDSYTKISASSDVGPSISPDDMFGSALAAIGDVDGNGVTDLLVTGTGERGDDAGVMHVLLLESDGRAKDAYKVQSGITDGNDRFGSSICVMDDLDRDGTSEILVGDSGLGDGGGLHVLHMNADVSPKRSITLDPHIRLKPGIEPGDLFGASVAAVGDVDRNGVVDIVVGSPKVDTGPTLGTDKGAVRLFFMGADGAFSRVVRIDDDTANGPDLSQFDRFGTSVAGIGDLNRDGTPDVAVGAPYVNTGPFDKGAVFILFLNPDGSVNKTKKIDDDTANGPTLQAFSKFGSSVAGIGDLDLDGTVDLAVGAEGHTSSNRGALFVLFMKPDGSVRQTAQIGQASGNGPALSSNGAFGSSVAPIGDLDGNGVVDIAVGADRTGSEGGAVYLLFMNANGTAKDTAVLSNGTAGMPTLLDGVSFGSSVAGPGDLDGDGAPDLLVGTPGDGSWGADTGVLYAIFLNPDGTVARTQLLDSVTPNIPDISSGDMFGSSIASLGDLNRDGVVDIAVGASGAGLGGDAHVLLLDKSTIVTGVTSPRPDGTYTEPGTLIPVEVSFSEPVTVTGTPYLLMDVGTPPRLAAYSSGSQSQTLTFSYEIGAGDVSPDLDYAGSSSLRILRDSSIKAQEQPSLDAALTLRPPQTAGSLSHAKDIIVNASLSGPPPETAPTYDATITNTNSIRLSFSEPVRATDPSAGWLLHGTDSGNLSVISATLDINGRSIELLLDAGVASTAPEMYITYDRSTGDVSNTHGVEPLDGTSVRVADGLPPTYRATISTDTAYLRFSEDIDTGLTNGQGWTLSGGMTSGIRVVANTDPEGLSNLMTLELSEILAQGTANVDYSPLAGDVVDLAGNALGTSSTEASIGIPEIESVKAMGRNLIAVTFSEPVNASSAAPDAWSLAGRDAGSLRIASHTDPAGVSSTMNLTLSDDLPNAGPEITLTYTRPASGGIVDSMEAQLETQTMRVLDALAPTLESIRVLSLRHIELGMSEPVSGSMGGPNGFALQVDGGAPPSVTSLEYSGSTILITLAQRLPDGAITLSYNGTLGDVRDAARPSNALATFSAHPVDTSPQGRLFITTWKTDAADQAVTIPVGLSSASFDVDWGDGALERNVTGDRSHVYQTAGTYTISISGDLEKIRLNNVQPNADRLASVEQWGGMRWIAMTSAFAGASSMVYNAPDDPDLSKVSDTRRMFERASSFNGDISAWNVSTVTDMQGMFSRASSFNQPLADWDVSGVERMAAMFERASSFNQPLADWNVSQVADMSHMFDGASSFNGDISDWDVSGVRNMIAMFSRATSFDQPLADWDVSQVADMSYMFEGATSFNGNISGWDTSKVTKMTNMFNGATSFNGDVSGWDVRKADDMTGMFDGAASFDQNLGKWYVTPGGFDVLSADLPGVIGTVSAQNGFLDGQNATYAIVTNTPGNHFTINSGALSMAAAAAGEYRVEIGATGTLLFGSGNTRTIQVSVSGASLPPKAYAGDDQTVAPGDTVTLDGAGSAHVGDITYLWVQDSGTAVTLSDETDPRPTFVAPQSPGTLVFTLIVTDTEGQAGSDTVVVTVGGDGAPDTSNQRPVIEIDGLSPARILLGTSPDGARCYDVEDGRIDHLVVATGNLDVNTPGVYGVTYVCTDSGGLSASISQQVTVSAYAVKAVKNPPDIMYLTVGDTFADPGAKCVPSFGAPWDAPVTGSVDTSTPGKYWISYVCRDPDGGYNGNEAGRKVVVRPQGSDTDAVPYMPPIPPLTIGVGSAYAPDTSDAACIDDRDPSPDIGVVHNGVDTSTAGMYFVVYQCTDSAGNSDSALQWVFVE